MRPRSLGGTGLEVSPLGLGMAALGRPGYLNVGHGRDLPAGHGVAEMERHAHAVLDAAHDGGVRYLDAARSYGRAERFVASWHRTRDAHDVTIGSKWGYTYTADWQVEAEQHEVKDHSLATLRRQIDETRGALGRLPDLYQVHSATLDSGVLDDVPVLDALAALAEEGCVIGLSVSGTGQAETLRRALALTADGIGPFRCVQATWNVLEPSVGPALAEASAAGWGVIVKEAVANGRLTPRGDAARSDVLTELAGRHGVGVDAIAVAAALAQPFADVVLSGASTVAQLRSNLRASEVGLDGDELARLGALAEDPAGYWEHRSGLRWT